MATQTSGSEHINQKVLGKENCDPLKFELRFQKMCCILLLQYLFPINTCNSSFTPICFNEKHLSTYCRQANFRTFTDS